MYNIPSKIDKYEIIKEIGRGGMAIVYLAYDSALEREVAIKVLPEYFKHDIEFIKRFKREAISASRLKHPNIVTVFDADVKNETPFIVMELLPGGSLEKLIKEYGKLPSYLVTKLSMEIADGLDIAHKNGILHRDIKPSNILFGADKRPVITDFGIAKSLTGTKLTTTGQVMGTPEYMAPEIIQGTLNTSFDIRSDIYSLGIVMYEMLTGNLPFKGETPLSIAFQQVNKKPIPIRKKNSSVPLSLVHIVEKCLKKKPEERYQTAEELYKDLSNIISRDEIISSKNKSEKILNNFVESSVRKLQGEEERGERKEEKRKDIEAEKETKETTNAIPASEADTKKNTAENVIASHKEEVQSKKQEPVSEGETKKIVSPLLSESVPSEGILSETETRKVGIGEETEGKTVIKAKDKEKQYQKQKPRNSLLKPSLLIPIIALIIAIPAAAFLIARGRNSINNNANNSNGVAYQDLGYVSVTSSPTNADVYINEDKIGTTPISKYKLKSGKYSIAIKKEGYKNYTKSITIEQNKTNNISATLLSLTNTETSLSVNSFPQSAEIYIDSKDTNKTTPATINDITLGKHILTIKKDGYKDYTSSITVNGGKTVSIVAMLTKKEAPAPQTGTLSVTSSPSGAKVYINNQYKDVNIQYKGITPLNITLNVGIYTINITKSNYKNYAKTITITENKTTNLSATLSPIVACSWEEMNNGLYGGKINSIAIDPKDTNIVYVGTYGDGVFKSTDGGESWKKLNNGLINTYVFSLVIDPKSTNVIYVGTDGGGVFKSTDGGASWSELSNGLPTNTDVECLAIDPANPNIIYVGTYGDGVFKSINAGVSWKEINNGIKNIRIYSLAIDPKNTDVIYAGTDGGGGIFKSINAGESWKGINNGLKIPFVLSLAIDPNNPNIIYAGPYGYGFFKSTNGGVSWKEINRGLTSRSIFVNSIAIDPKNTNIVYIGTNGYHEDSGSVFKSTNGGESWKEINRGLPFTRVKSIAINPNNTSIIYAGTDGGGIFKYICTSP